METAAQEAGVGVPETYSLAVSTRFKTLTAFAGSRSTEELREELGKLLGFTADNLLRLAIIVNELETRGEDLSELKLGLLPLLRKIAAGELLPELVAMYAGRPKLLGIIATKLSRQDQMRAVAGELNVEDIAPAKKKFRGRSFHSYEEPTVKHDVSEVARHGTPRDIGELAAELIIASEDREMALQHFMLTIPFDLQPILKGDVLHGGHKGGARAVVGFVTPAKGPRNRIAIEDEPMAALLSGDDDD